MLRLFLIALVATLPISVLADDLVVHGASYHFDRDKVARANMNEANYGLGYRRDNIEIGTYLNSYHKQSAYAMELFPLVKSCGLLVGAATGYPLPLLPIMGAYCDVLDYVAIKVSPPVSYKGRSTKGLIAISLKIPLGE